MVKDNKEIKSKAEALAELRKAQDLLKELSNDNANLKQELAEKVSEIKSLNY